MKKSKQTKWILIQTDVIIAAKLPIEYLKFHRIAYGYVSSLGLKYFPTVEDTHLHNNQLFFTTSLGIKGIL